MDIKSVQAVLAINHDLGLHACVLGGASHGVMAVTGRKIGTKFQDIWKDYDKFLNDWKYDGNAIIVRLKVKGIWI